MAELIPMQYRLRIAQKAYLRRWIIVGGLATVVSLASVTHAFMWQLRQTTVESGLAAQVQERSSVLLLSRRVVASRQELADKMQKIEQLMDDKTLLSLLKNISEGFSGSDCLEYISIDARGKTLADHTTKNEKDASPHTATPAADGGRYVVRISGITANNATLKDLVDRLSQRASPAMNVGLESSRRENMFDGQVMHFEIVCEKPGDLKGT